MTALGVLVTVALCTAVAVLVIAAKGHRDLTRLRHHHQLDTLDAQLAAQPQEPQQ